MQIRTTLCLVSLFVATSGFANDLTNSTKDLDIPSLGIPAATPTTSESEVQTGRLERARTAGLTDAPSPRKADIVLYFDLAAGVAKTRDVLALPQGLRLRARVRMPINGRPMTGDSANEWVEARLEMASLRELEAYDEKLPPVASSETSVPSLGARTVQPLLPGCSGLYDYPVVTVNMYNGSEYLGTQTAFAEEGFGSGGTCWTLVSQYAYPNVEDVEVNPYFGSTNQYYTYDFGWRAYSPATYHVFNVPNAPVTYPTPLTYVTFGMSFWADRSGKGEPNVDFTTEITGYVMYE